MSIEIKELTKSYGSQKAIDALSFSVNKGEIVGFLGPNGAGKSTTMKVCTGYIKPTSGTAHICGVDVLQNPKACQQKIGYLPEHNPLYLDDYVKEYLAFSAKAHQMSGTAIKKRIPELIDLCGLEREQHKKIGALSKGYRQRVGLAQALIHDPEVLILDEPTTGLDPNQILEIRQVIKQVSQDKTVIFSTHIMQEVQALCDRVIIINLGKVVADNSVEKLVHSEERNEVSLTFDKPVDFDKLKEVAGVLEIKAVSPHKVLLSTALDFMTHALIQVIAENQWNLVEMKKEVKTLETIFGQITQNA